MTILGVSTEVITKDYQKTQENFFLSKKMPEKRQYNSLQEMLNETVLLGNFKFGNNFIG